MLTSHEIFGFMSPPLAARILENAYEHNRDLYRATLASVADARKLRPTFYERTPRATRHAEMAVMLSKPRLELVAANLLRDWLMRDKLPMLKDFLDKLGVKHKDGAVDDLPATIDEAVLKGAVDLLLTKYPPEEVAVYLNAFYAINDVRWPNLDVMLKEDARLQFGG
jgi:hypothetical protein